MLDRVLNIAEGDFEEVALEVFGRQARECAPYREYLRLIGVGPGEVRSLEAVPFLPIEFFKSHKVWCGTGEPELTFVSSGTGGTGGSRHYVAQAADYERTFRKAFEMFYGDGVRIYALLPGYRPESSLIYMVRGLGGKFYLGEPEKLMRDLAADGGKKMLFGVSHALLDLAENHPAALRGTVVMETGGMKGRRKELSKEELHRRLREAFGVAEVHSEYGMAELSSQAYSAAGGRFATPPWMRAVVRDLNDPFRILSPGRRGGLNVIDLANLHSCAFIQTQDLGTVFVDGTFTVDGRADRSEIRGCNLLFD
jgi:hypothetical protein